jgi:hypothetical protein
MFCLRWFVSPWRLVPFDINEWLLAFVFEDWPDHLSKCQLHVQKGKDKLEAPVLIFFRTRKRVYIFLYVLLFWKTKKFLVGTKSNLYSGKFSETEECWIKQVERSLLVTGFGYEHDEAWAANIALFKEFTDVSRVCLSNHFAMLLLSHWTGI